MTSCTIIISHYESLSFLRAAIRQTRKHAVPEISQHIIISDQSHRKVHGEVVELYGKDLDITIVWTRPYYSGFGIDQIMRNDIIKTEYICQLHADAFGISDKYLALPIALIEENNFSFVGQLQCISKTTDTIYPPSPFFAMSPTFNVARTETYKELSLKAGFTRFHNRPQAGMVWENNDWAGWAAADYNKRGSDDDIVAFSWQDRHREHDKLGLAISGFIESHYGRIIDDIVFHFCSCREATTVMDKMPEGYRKYSELINIDYSDSLIDEMVSLARANRPPEMQILTRNVWDGKSKTASPPSDELNKRIEELKNGLD